MSSSIRPYEKDKLVKSFRVLMGPSKNNFSGYSIVIFTESLVNNVLKINDKAFVVVSASQINATLSAFGHEEKMAKILFFYIS